MKNGGPAFPTRQGTVGETSGMSLRDWLAGMALSGLCAHAEKLSKSYVLEHGGSESAYSAQAYALADAMLAAREKEA